MEKLLRTQRQRLPPAELLQQLQARRTFYANNEFSGSWTPEIDGISHYTRLLHELTSIETAAQLFENKEGVGIVSLGNNGTNYPNAAYAHFDGENIRYGSINFKPLGLTISPDGTVLSGAFTKESWRDLRTVPSTYDAEYFDSFEWRKSHPHGIALEFARTLLRQHW